MAYQSKHTGNEIDTVVNDVKRDLFLPVAGGNIEYLNIINSSNNHWPGLSFTNSNKNYSGSLAINLDESIPYLYFVITDKNNSNNTNYYALPHFQNGGGWYNILTTKDQLEDWHIKDGAITSSKLDLSLKNSLFGDHRKPTPIDCGFTSSGGSAPYYGVRAWCQVLINNGVVSIPNSGNIASVTRSSAGIFQIKFAIAMPHANYAVAGSAEAGGAGQEILGIYAYSTTGFTLDMTNHAGTLTDPTVFSFIVVC